MGKVFFFINTIPPDYGGGYLRVFKIAARFKSKGLLFKIGTYTKSSRYPGNLHGVANEDLLFYRNKFLSSFFVIPFQLVRYHSDFDVFYIASTHWFTVVPTVVARLLKKKIVHGVTLSMVDSPAAQTSDLFTKPYYWFKNRQFKLADYIFVNSPLLVSECKTCGYNEDVVKLINNPVDTTKYAAVDSEKKKQLKESIGIFNDNLTILFVGSFNKRKGCDLFPLIFKKLLLEERMKVNFIMCGQKGYPETNGILAELESLFKDSGNVLVVKEEVGNTAPYYQMTDIFLFPTTNEGMPNVILEAMASGCMILCHRLPGITDYILDNEFLVDNNNEDDYVNRIREFVNNQDHFLEGIKNNTRKMIEYFSIQSVDNYIQQILS